MLSFTVQLTLGNIYCYLKSLYIWDNSQRRVSVSARDDRGTREKHHNHQSEYTDIRHRLEIDSIHKNPDSPADVEKEDSIQNT
jgi:hypothetical protein